eukprot:jgi/Orpsp1_1/1174465/evm.model.c7180000050226.1
MNMKNFSKIKKFCSKPYLLIKSKSQKLNDVTIRNSYPLPLIAEIIERVKGAKYFTKLDLRSAYNLIRIREGDEYKTAFRTKYEKCEFDKNEVEFLGYILSGKGVSTDPKKIKSIKEWPIPTCVKDVQRFIGLCNYYRRFVKNFAQIARPLHNLTKKNIKFSWNENCQKSFEELKNHLISTPILMHPDPEKQYILECDASNYAIGAILSQYDDENRLHPVAYYSRSLNNAEINYPITDKELLAIKDSFSTWRHLLLEILMKYHESPNAGHLGIKRTLELITRNFWWPKIQDDVKNFVSSCENCARNKINRHRRYGLLQPLETPERPWKSIEIDFLCGLPNSKGFTTLMVVVDRFSKMIHLIPFKDVPNAQQTAKAFMKYIYKLHGFPSDIYTDRGTQFTSALWNEFMNICNIRLKIATTDHHETVGQVERCNSFIEQYLRLYSRAYYHDDWVDWIHLAEFAYNNSVNESTKETPFFINYGFHPSMDEYFLLPQVDTNSKFVNNFSETFNHIKDVLLRSKELYKNTADKKRMEPPILKEGDRVWIQAPPTINIEDCSKLAPCKYGPYKIISVLENNNYKLDIRI